MNTFRALQSGLKQLLVDALVGADLGFISAHLVGAITAFLRFPDPAHWWFHYSGAWAGADYHLISLALILPMSAIGAVLALASAKSS